MSNWAAYFGQTPRPHSNHYLDDCGGVKGDAVGSQTFAVDVVCGGDIVVGLVTDVVLYTPVYCNAQLDIAPLCKRSQDHFSTHASLITHRTEQVPLEAQGGADMMKHTCRLHCGSAVLRNMRTAPPP